MSLMSFIPFLLWGYFLHCGVKKSKGNNKRKPHNVALVRTSVRPNFVSEEVLCNYWLEFNETLWESSILRGDAHIAGLFRSDPLTQSYGP
jgi:hypothetical protein